MTNNYNHPILNYIHENQDGWNWIDLSSNKFINYTFLLDHINKPWNWYILSSNSNLTSSVFRSQDTAWHKFPWRWDILSANIINFEIVLKYPDLPWHYNHLSVNKHLEPDYVYQNMTKPWNWGDLLRRTVYEDTFLDSKILSKHPELTFKIVRSFIDWNWDFKEMTKNPGITLRDIQTNPNSNWDWDWLMSNKSSQIIIK